MGKKRRKKKKQIVHYKNKTDQHHLNPQSRGGKNSGNIVVWDVMFHRKWHELFGNMTVYEIYEFIEAITRPNEVWTSHDLSRLKGRLKCSAQ